MAPHLTGSELDQIQKLWAQSKTPTQILAAITKERSRNGIEAPKIRAVHKALRGVTHRRGIVETRGRKRSWKPSQVQRAYRVRKQIIKKAKGEKEIHWTHIISKARVPHVHASTAMRSIARSELPTIAARRPREKPLRTEEHEADRERLGKRFAKKPPSYFTGLDLIMDNKKFDIPRSATAKRYAKMRKVRFHLRARGEGLEAGFTKPRKSNKVNPGASVNVCAGIIQNRIKLWHYLPRKWNGDAAAELYRGPVIQTLRRTLGKKRAYTIMEDNDPTGYKSNKAKLAKKELNIHPIEFPRYSPDLMPLDYSIWKAIEDKMAASVVKKETVDEFKKRLRRTAMNLPTSLIRKAVEAMPKRAAAVAKAGGGDVPRD